MNRHPLRVLAAWAALTVGSVAGLGWLAPLEYGTGSWLGMRYGLAVCVPLLVDSYVILSVLTGLDRRYALPIAGLSGFVGQLHAAGVLPETDVRVRGAVAAVAAVIAVAVTARLKPLVQTVVGQVHAEAEAARDAALAAERARLEEAHRREVEAAEREHARAVELAQIEAAREAAAAAAAERTEAAARAALLAEQARTERTSARRTAKPPTARSGRTAHGAQADDLRRRSQVRERFAASVRAGAPLDSTALARLMYELGDDVQPDSGQLRAARARASEWRRAVEAERTDEPHAAVI